MFGVIYIQRFDLPRYCIDVFKVDIISFPEFFGLLFDDRPPPPIDIIFMGIVKKLIRKTNKIRDVPLTFISTVV